MTTNSPTLLVRMDWPWKSEDPGIHIILVSDEQFINLANHPDEAIEKIFPQDPQPISLREHCRRGAERGATTLRVAYDYFFGGSKRGLYPDTEAFQEALKKVHDVAREFGIGLEPSILSPLELGVGYQAKTGEAGRWMQYREGLRDPQTGEYSVTLWQHQQWCNNKGPTPVKLIGARAFAFREERIPNTCFFAVNPAEIIELPSPGIEEIPGMRADTTAHFRAVRVRVSGRGGGGLAANLAQEVQGNADGLSFTTSQSAGNTAGGLNRVLVVMQYKTVEMDYFSPKAEQFLEDLIQQYHGREISLTGVYADETHIQQDWSYHAHHENGQFTLRYVSEGFERAFAAQFGAEYGDFAKYLVYFTCHQHDFASTHEPKLPAQHVFGRQQEDIARTLLFRRNYYQFLEVSVVKLMTAARQKAEALNGRLFDVYYHSTWAESPTCDAYAVDGVHTEWTPAEHRRKYDYTPEFLWSNTIHQASAACANQFAWNDFLTGGNDDTPEGGYADRNYYGRALACSLAALNRSPLASAGMWGMPPAAAQRMSAVSAVFGAGGHPAFRSVQDYAPRQIEALFLYPQDLVAIEERFGSWITQYGYANLITAEKLIEHGQATPDGKMAVKGALYRTLGVLYEPFPSLELLNLLREFVARGGVLIWSGIPPLINRAEFSQLLGVDFVQTPDPLGLALPARQVTFAGGLNRVAPMSILTDFVVDRVFPLRPQEGVETSAWLRPGGSTRPLCVGTCKIYPSGGQALTFGFRLRDDQAASTGSEARAWFEVLQAVGTYPGQDNPTVISRQTPYVAGAFPNGALALAPHFCQHEENWPGGFFRDQAADQRALEETPLPEDWIEVRDFAIAGQVITYRGRHAVAWRMDGERLEAFAGVESCAITINGQVYTWAERPVEVGWHPLSAAMNSEDYQGLYRVWCNTEGKISLPLNLQDENIQVWRGANLSGRGRRAVYGRVGFGEAQVAFEMADGCLNLEIDEESAGRWLYVVKPLKS